MWERCDTCSGAGITVGQEDGHIIVIRCSNECRRGKVLASNDNGDKHDDRPQDDNKGKGKDTSREDKHGNTPKRTDKR
jgi:hypothetical protein